MSTTDFKCTTYKFVSQEHYTDYNGEQEKLADDCTCMICYDQISKDSSRIITYHKPTKASVHTFHKDCVLTWFKKQKDEKQPNTCPYCKSGVDIDPILTLHDRYYFQKDRIQKAISMHGIHIVTSLFFGISIAHLPINNREASRTLNKQHAAYLTAIISGLARRSLDFTQRSLKDNREVVLFLLEAYTAGLITQTVMDESHTTSEILNASLIGLTSIAASYAIGGVRSLSERWITRFRE